uniref:Uncharacterized protein n=1 Tax=Hanusia phi TaxID=3032 RepID=A0A7S0I0V3_9CRYP|mmetsp:Transcript_7667/g.17496  ORF Transcript_7667/g.17496 Transcript_7667/m.17496 type:complete len:369 (+) Transcript_7667:143-1249(+)
MPPKAADDTKNKLANRLWAALNLNTKKTKGTGAVQVHRVTWRDGTTGKPSTETALVATFSFAALLVAVVYQNFHDAMIWMEWIESYKIFNANVSWLDFCGSCVVCHAFRVSLEKSIKAGDARIINMCKTAFGCYATTICTCTFLQFGGTTTTGAILGQYPSWLAGTHVFSAFLLAWWLTFCSPFDIWHFWMKTPWLMIPIKAFATISSAHAITSWGMEKALNAEHERMRKSVWAALLCGFTSGSFGWVVVSYFETGGSAIVASAPSWAMQRAWYLIWLYYALTDPHGVLRAVGARLEGISPVLSMLMMSPVSKSAGKVVVATCCLVLQFALDICCYDLLPHLNKFFAIFWRAIAPLKMDRVYIPPRSE